jgi:hypothetical protein
VFSSIGDNLAAIVLVLAGLGLLSLVFVQTMRINRLSMRIDMLTGGAEGDLETVLTEHLEIVHEVGRDLDELTARTAVLEASGRHHYTRQGLVRFNPFEDTGGNQSFALALLDESDDGFIISSLHSRTGTRIYAKVVTNGKADTNLSTEEAQAIEEARVKRNVGPGATGRAAASRTKAAAAAAVAGASRQAPVADEMNESSPAPVVKAVAVAVPAKPAPAPSKPAPVKAAPSKPAPVKAAPVAVPAADVHESVVRASSERIKGQSKSSVAIDHAAADAEKLGRKPGHRPTPGSE